MDPELYGMEICEEDGKTVSQLDLNLCAQPTSGTSCPLSPTRPCFFQGLWHIPMELCY